MTAKIQYPKIDLYHYTSIGSLFSILQNETIRLTDYRFLNDTQELSYALNWLKDYLAPKDEEEFGKKVLTAIGNIEHGKMERIKSVGGGSPYMQRCLCDIHYYVL